MTMKEWPSCFPISWIVQMFGWFNCGSGTGFTTETFQRQRVVGDLVRQEFERDKTTKLGVFGFVDDTHPAAAQLLDDPVV